MRLERDNLYALGVHTFGPSISNNAVRIVARELSPSLARLLEDRFGDVPLVFKEGPEPTNATIPPPRLGCERLWSSCNPLRGGTNLHTSPTNQTSANCTLGFNARTSTGARRIVTAGHCGDTYYHSGSLIGNTTVQQDSGSVDAQAMWVASGWSTSRWVIHDGSSLAQAYQIQSRYLGNSLATSATVCTTGANSEATGCGAVIDGNVDPPGHRDMFTFNNCMRGGDSGAPVYAGYRAYGVAWGYIGCESYVSYIVNVEDVLNVTITTQ